ERDLRVSARAAVHRGRLPRVDGGLRIHHGAEARDARGRGRPRRVARRERARARNTLVVVQVALALVLVVSALLMIRTFAALRSVDAGFADPSSIQTVRTWAPNELFREP